jgi:hypothetical protein
VQLECLLPSVFQQAASIPSHAIGSVLESISGSVLESVIAGVVWSVPGVYL